MSFRQGAGECLLSAMELDKTVCANLTGEYLITFHALELALKAFLAKAGLTAMSLKRKPYSHNLLNLYTEACRRGMHLPMDDVRPVLERINHYHDDDARLRYNFADSRELPICSALFPIVNAILEEAHIPPRRVQQDAS